MCDYKYTDNFYCDDCPYMKRFPVYKQVFSACRIIPANISPNKCFSIKSYHVAVKSQQLGFLSGKKSCCEESSPPCCCLVAPDPSNGFQLIEYADKCCSDEPCPCPCPKKCMSVECIKRKCISKAIITDCCRCCNKSIHCDMFNASCVPSKVLCLPPPSKSCLKSKVSSVRVVKCSQNKSPCIDRKSSCKEIVLCQKCREKRKKKKNKRYERCHCKSGSVVYYHRKCSDCIKDRSGSKCIDESYSKVQCDKYKCKYLDLIHRIKCIFTKSDNT